MNTLPKAFISEMEALFAEDAGALLEGLQKEPHRSLRIRRGKGGSDLLKALKAAGLLPKEAERGGPDSVPWEKNGFYFPFDAPCGRHALHEAGFYYIQEASAMAPVSFLSPRPGERILDLCAAPGGKTTQIGNAMEGKGLLVSNEIHPARAKILSENVERMGLSNCIVTNETPDALAAAFPLFFDAILVDAPCSGEGMFRKNEEAANQWSPENVAMCAERQTDILEAAHRMLRPGGRLVYSTCTFSLAENEQQIQSFLSRHPDYTPGSRPLQGGMAASELSGDGGLRLNKDAGEGAMVRLLPHLVRGEGHFAAVLQKAGALPENADKETGKKRSRKDLPAPLASFIQDLFKDPDFVTPSLLYSMGPNLYLLPQSLPLEGIRLIRPGLQLGSIEKDRFIPSHSLARALSVYDINNYVNLSSSSEKDRALLSSYLEGGTFPREGEKGWYLIAMDGEGIGWGKLSGGIMKNHYPKGLRKKTLF